MKFDNKNREKKYSVKVEEIVASNFPISIEREFCLAYFFRSVHILKNINSSRKLTNSKKKKLYFWQVTSDIFED